MKCIYWNIRGIAKTPSKLALRKLINDNKPDIVVIAEPWIDFLAFPSSWLQRLGLKMFSLNDRDNLLPNIWCICKINLNPIVLFVDNQCVAFTLSEMDKVFGIVAVYASTCYVNRRNLWSSLSHLNSNNDIPWCFLGDFNVVLGIHEYSGNYSPADLPMNEFQEWTNSNNLLHLPTRGAWYTWSNGRRGRAFTEKRLDRAICNQTWLNLCCKVSCSTLIRNKSDHYPLLLDFQFSDSTFVSQFKFLKMWSLHPTCKELISDCWNTNFVGSPMFVLCSKLKLLKEKLKVWNREVFGNVHSSVKEAEDTLRSIQCQLQSQGHSDALSDLEKSAQSNLDDALLKHNWFWQEKAKVRWHTDGDRNTSYFHRIAKIKNTTKLMSALKIGDVLTTDPHLIAEHVVHFYQNLFCTNSIVLQDELVVDEVIPSIIDDRVNDLLTLLPSSLEIKNAVFDLNKDGAPGPDGFGAFFFQTYWEIIHLDVVSAVSEFFSTGCFMPNFNANALILIPKNSNADTIEQFRPIALANFKFKIISKVLADRLAQIMPSFISKEQRGFIHGRNIKDCLCLASEAANLLHSKSFGGNLALQIDVTKAFDTLDWKFLLKVLRSFGFCDKFCNWIESILNSATLSISINGKMHGYFNCKRGVRQGDPLSPLLFCIAEEVLSRQLSKLVADGNLHLIKGTRLVNIPSHCLYADDIMVYCNGRHSNLAALKHLFSRYALASGQVVNARKSTIFAGGISNARLQQISQFIGFNIGSFPFTYLGIPIFKGKPKKAYLQPIADKIKAKLSAWKASLLSIAGRIQLVKSVIHSMLVYSISIYAWPVSLLKDLERWIKNFIWAGDINQRKIVTVAWKKVCKPFDQGGLGIRSLIALNEASNLKLCWDLLQSQEHWAILLRSRVIRGDNCIHHHIFSSIWSSIKSEFNTIKENAGFVIGTGVSVNFWRDKWCGSQSIAEQLHLPHHLVHFLEAKVSDFIVDNSWHIPAETSLLFPNLIHLVSQVTIPLDQHDDNLVWLGTDSGALSLKEAFTFKSQIQSKLHWAKTIWSIDIPPSKSLVSWRLMHDKLPTDDNLMLRGCLLPSVCSLCFQQVETSFHLFFDCVFAVNIWNWFSEIIGLNLNFNSIEDIWLLCDRNWKPQCKVVIKSALVNIISTIWFVRNQTRFNNKHIHWKNAISMISSNASLSGNNTKQIFRSSMADFRILKYFKVIVHPPKAPSIVEVLWHPPSHNWIKCNSDGASTNLASACGGIFRNHSADLVACFAENLGSCSSLIAELSGVMRAIELSVFHNWPNLWIETDSSLAVLAFKSPTLIPWTIRNRWINCQKLISSMNLLVSHIYREGNVSADSLANMGLNLTDFFFSNSPPSCIVNSITRDKLGMPSFRFSL
jgi:ribonuclease HI